MKPVDVKDNTYFDSSKKVNDKHPKFKVGDHVRISKYTNIFAKGYTPNWFEVFVIKKLKIIDTFYEKELKKNNQQEFRIEKVIKKPRVINYMSHGKVMIVHLIAGLIKMT